MNDCPFCDYCADCWPNVAKHLVVYHKVTHFNYLCKMLKNSIIIKINTDVNPRLINDEGTIYFRMSVIKQGKLKYVELPLCDPNNVSGRHLIEDWDW